MICSFLLFFFFSFFSSASLTLDQGSRLQKGFDLLTSISGNFKTPTTPCDLENQGLLSHTDEGMKCWIDGSYDDGGEGGWAYVLHSDGALVRQGYGFGKITSPFHGELQALQLAMRSVAQDQARHCVFYTDFQVLCRLLNGEDLLDVVPWQCFFRAQDAIQFFRANRFSCAFISRRGGREMEREAIRTRVCELLRFSAICFARQRRGGGGRSTEKICFDRLARRRRLPSLSRFLTRRKISFFLLISFLSCRAAPLVQIHTVEGNQTR